MEITLKAVGHMYLVLDCRSMARRLLSVKQFVCPSVCKISDFLPDERADCVCNEYLADLVPLKCKNAHMQLPFLMFSKIPQ